ncbi:GNAT family N-acetyltransferase [Catellatospora coxensis]|uniref:N-acetyltransferase n=1 Tax=Catellatospora coxensis TaxID=310354 RepID=A0A8J3L3A5_9ACTN|nr:GNAT family N-acetyltransferase [Catellatospora coxensis]GIG06940.1 N-acetyltransferase [Catellatospora coxensis]
MTGSDAVSTAPAVDTAAAGRLISASFQELAVAHWLLDDPVERERIMAGQFGWFAEHALAYGAVDVAGDDAVAVWFDNTVDAPWIDGYDERLVELAGPHAARFALLDEVFAEHHPHGRPHWHLALLAVRPGLRGTGLGSELLGRRLAQLDAEGVPAYLEASSTGSRDLYLRHGFALLGEAYHLPGGGPALYPMWREPQG